MWQAQKISPEAKLLIHPAAAYWERTTTAFLKLTSRERISVISAASWEIWVPRVKICRQHFSLGDCLLHVSTLRFSWSLIKILGTLRASSAQHFAVYLVTNTLIAESSYVNILWRQWPQEDPLQGQVVAESGEMLGNPLSSSLGCQGILTQPLGLDHLSMFQMMAGEWKWGSLQYPAPRWRIPNIDEENIERCRQGWDANRWWGGAGNRWVGSHCHLVLRNDRNGDTESCANGSHGTRAATDKSSLAWRWLTRNKWIGNQIPLSSGLPSNIRSVLPLSWPQLEARGEWDVREGLGECSFHPSHPGISQAHRCILVPPPFQHGGSTEWKGLDLTITHRTYQCTSVEHKWDRNFAVLSYWGF